MFKYKVGDYVKIRSDLKVWEMYGSLACHPYAARIAGTKQRIGEITEAGNYRISGRCFSPEMIEGYAEFYKYNLKPGMGIKMADGDRGIVSGNYILGINSAWCFRLDGYDENLNHFNCSDYNINEVYEANGITRGMYLFADERYSDLVWKRVKPLRITEQEIKELLADKLLPGQELEIVAEVE